MNKDKELVLGPAASRISILTWVTLGMRLRGLPLMMYYVRKRRNANALAIITKARNVRTVII